MPILFSYGTLRQEGVQLSTFGRLLEGRTDELVGFELEEPDGGKRQHANVRFTGRDDSRVSGTVFEITDAELAAADRYERLGAYERVTGTLASGRQAWVYLDAGSARELHDPR